MPAVPLYVSTDFQHASFNPGTGLPTITSTGVLITDQPTMDSVFAAAGAAGIVLKTSATAPAGYTGAVASSAAFADGQIPVWSATLGQFIPANPVGQGELAYAQNVTGTPTSITTAGGVGTVVDVLGCTISVPSSNGRAVVVEFGATLFQQVVGAGSIYLELNETTSGNVNVHSAIAPAPQRTGTIDASQCVLQLDSQYRIGVVTTPRQFKLSAAMYTAAGTLTGQLLNAATSPSYLAAIAR